MTLWAAAALLALLTAAALAGRLGWPLEIAASLAPQIGAAGLALAVAAFGLGAPGPGLTGLAVAGLCAHAARELFERPAPALEARHARVVWANVLTLRGALARVLRLAEAEGADIVLIAELPRLSAAELLAIAGPFTHHAGRPALEGVNVAALSRTPIADVRALAGPAGRRGIALTLETPAGALRILGVHPNVPFTPALQAGRDATVRAALALAEQSAPALVVGDFNTPPWSSTMRDGLRGGRVRRASLGARSTWLTPLPVLGLPIDHACASANVQVSARTGPFVGSDHWPLIVDIALRDGQEGPRPSGNQADPREVLG